MKTGFYAIKVQVSIQEYTFLWEKESKHFNWLAIHLTILCKHSCDYIMFLV